MKASDTIDSNSMFYRLAYVYGTLDEGRDQIVDRCTYYRNVVIGFMVVVAVTLFAGGACGMFIGVPLAYLAAGIMLGTWIQLDPPMILVTVTWAGTLISGVYALHTMRKAALRAKTEADFRTKYGEDEYVHYFYQYLRSTKEVKSEPSELVKWWRARQEKICIMLEVK